MLFFNLETILYISIPIAIILITLIIVFFIKGNKNKKQQLIIDNYYNTIINCVGGLDNIISVSFNSSRLSLQLNDTNKLDEEGLKKIQITGVFKTSKKVTLIVGNMAEKYCQNINKQLENK